jgi:hypothetical protein
LLSLSLLRYSIKTSPERKNGIAGILNLTIAPKLDVETPTEKAKNNPKIMQNKTKGLVKRELIKLVGLLIKKNKAKKSTTKFSSAENTITIFFASHKKGLNNPVAVAIGNLDKIPVRLCS